MALAREFDCECLRAFVTEPWEPEPESERFRRLRKWARELEIDFGDLSAEEASAPNPRVFRLAPPRTGRVTVLGQVTGRPWMSQAQLYELDRCGRGW